MTDYHSGKIIHDSIMENIYILHPNQPLFPELIRISKVLIL